MPRPIVLAHGIARFDVVFAGLGVDIYFKRVPRHLRARGFDAHRSNVDFAGSVDKRASDLQQEVEHIRSETGADKVHIIAHSMGGLDARHMIVDLGMASRVASLTTIGTPHLGTVFADVGLARGDALIDLFRPIGIRIEGFRDLSTASCREFNQAAQDAEARNTVRYQVYSSHQQKARVVAPLQLSWQIIRDGDGGDNDGLVPVTSQEWVRTLRAADGTTKNVPRHRFGFGADHLNQTGSWDPNELATLHPLGFLSQLRIRRYERRVRDIYLKIARNVTAAD